MIKVINQNKTKMNKKELYKLAIEALKFMQREKWCASLCWAFSYAIYAQENDVSIEIACLNTKTLDKGHLYVNENLIQYRPEPRFSFGYWWEFHDFETRINLLKSLL